MAENGTEHLSQKQIDEREPYLTSMQRLLIPAFRQRETFRERVGRIYGELERPLLLASAGLAFGVAAFWVYVWFIIGGGR